MEQGKKCGKILNLFPDAETCGKPANESGRCPLHLIVPIWPE